MLSFIIVNSLYYLSITYLSNNLHKARIKNLKYTYLIGEIFAILIAIITEQTISLVSTIIIFSSYLVYVLICYKGTILNKVLTVFLFYLILFGGEIISNLMLSFFIDLSYLLNSKSIGFIIISFISGMVSLLLSHLLIIVIKGLNWKKYPKSIYLIFILPITTIVLLLNINNYTTVIENNKILTFTLILLVLCNFITFYVFINAINITNRMNVIKEQKEKTDLYNEYMTTLYNSNFNFMHTIIRKLMKIQNDFNNSIYDNASYDLFELNQLVLQNFNLINTSSNVIGPIINSHLEQITNYNIQYKSVIEVSDFPFLDLKDQRYLFSYLLSIGINSCILSNEEEKVCILKTKRQDNVLYIQVLFSTSLIFEKEEFNIKYKGIIDIVNKYDGLMIYEEVYDDKISSILIRFLYH